MNREELERLENKLKVDSLSDEEIGFLFKEIRSLKKELSESYDIIEANQTTRDYFTNIYCAILCEDEQQVKVPPNVVKNLTKISITDCPNLIESKDYTIKHNEDSDSYTIDFSNYMMNTRDFNDDSTVEVVQIHYTSWR